MTRFKMLSALIAASSVAASLYAQDPAALQKKLVSEYALTQPTADNTDIVTAGAILVLQKSNLMMAPTTSSNAYQNTYKDGKISQNAFGKTKSVLGRVGRIPGVGIIPGSGTAASADAASGPPPRTYVTGERMWVTKIEVKAENKEEGVVFDLFTDAIDDVRYKASLRIPYPKGATPDQVDRLVAEVFKVQPAEDAQQQQQAPAGGQQAPAAAAGGQEAVPAVAAPPAPADNAPVPDIAPPPPPADAAPAGPPPTVSLGQTPDQVVAILGQPQKIVKLAGTKQTYYYKDLKVIFTGGKVTDVQ